MDTILRYNASSENISYSQDNIIIFIYCHGFRERTVMSF